MTRRIAAVARMGVCLLLVMAASAFAADANPSKSAVGNWILNPAKSHFENTAAPRMARLRVSKDDEAGLKWSLTGADADGKGYHEEYEGPTDGTYHPIKGAQNPKTVAYTRAGSFTSWVVKDETGATIETGSSSVSPDGRTLTLKGTMRTPQGESQFTSVYDRR